MNKNKILTVGRRNHIEVTGRRYSISKIISESYQTLYSCELDSKLYKLTESHINDVKLHPEATERLSRNLEILKGLVKLGENAKINESDIDELEDENLLEEEIENPEEDEEISESEEEEIPEEETSGEEEELLAEEDFPSDEEELEEECTEESEITPEELDELKKYLKEIRARRKRESEEIEKEEELQEIEEKEEEEEIPVQESSSWSTEKSSMTAALKNFRESSNKKAFYKSFTKLQERMKNPSPLSLEESILLYKASNSAMTHLAVELEHNPEFIYTFRECTKLLSIDNNKLLECIRKQESPEKSLVESYRAFTNILLESEDFEDEIIEDDEEVVLSSEEESEETPVDEPIVDNPEEEFDESEEEVVPEEESPAEEVLEEESPEEEEEVLVEESPEEEEVPPALEEDPVEEPLEEEDEDPLDDEITDEEARELYNKLAEMRKGLRK